MKPHRKRALANWNQGKGYKGDSEERQFAKREIQAMVKEMDEAFLYKHRSKPKPNRRARLEYSIAWYEAEVQKCGRGIIRSMFTDALKTAKEQLKKLIEKEDSK